MQTSVLGNYFKLKTTLGIISWKFLGLKLRYISQKFKGSPLRFSSGSNLFMTGWTLNWTLSLVQEVQVRTLVQNRTLATLAFDCEHCLVGCSWDFSSMWSVPEYVAEDCLMLRYDTMCILSICTMTIRACSALPQVSDSQLTLFVHAVFLPAIAVWL